jgi:hypothetical protein
MIKQLVTLGCRGKPLVGSSQPARGEGIAAYLQGPAEHEVESIGSTTKLSKAEFGDNLDRCSLWHPVANY